jgi:hypothetical protein
MKFLKLLDIIILLVISITAICITIFDIFDFHQVVSQNFNYSQLAVLILSFIGIHLSISFIVRNNYQNATKNELEKIIPSLQGSKIKTFDSSDEMEIYIAKRIREAKIEIADLTWKKSLSSGYSLPKREKSRATYDNSIKVVSKTVEYKEVFIFSDKRRVEKLKQRIKENREGYSCKYFPVYTDIPRLQFVLIDKKEVIFASSTYKQLIAIENVELGLLLDSYFEKIWEEAVWIMKGKEIYQGEVDKIMSEHG